MEKFEGKILSKESVKRGRRKSEGKHPEESREKPKGLLDEAIERISANQDAKKLIFLWEKQRLPEEDEQDFDPSDTIVRLRSEFPTINSLQAGLFDAFIKFVRSKEGGPSEHSERFPVLDTARFIASELEPVFQDFGPIANSFVRKRIIIDLEEANNYLKEEGITYLRESEWLSEAMSLLEAALIQDFSPEEGKKIRQLIFELESDLHEEYPDSASLPDDVAQLFDLSSRLQEKLSASSEIRMEKKIQELGYIPFSSSKELRKVVMASSATRKKELERFMEEYRQRRTSIAKLQEELMKSISQNPEQASKDLMEIVFGRAANLRLTSNDLALFEKLIASYTERRQKIKEYLEKFPKPEDLFEHLTGKEPVGKVELKVTPVMIMVRCFDFEDYVAIYAGRRLPFLVQEEKARKDLLREVERIAGVYRPNIEGGVIAAQKITGTKDEEISQHEEQHAIQEFFRETGGIQGMEEDFQDARSREEQQIVLERLLRFFRESRIDHRIKDEILAHYQGGTSLWRIKEYLLKKKERGGLYDYFERLGPEVDSLISRYVQLLSDEFPSWVGALKTKVFESEKVKLIDSALLAIIMLEMQGKKKGEILQLLMPELIQKWKKMALRLGVPVKFEQLRELFRETAAINALIASLKKSEEALTSTHGGKIFYETRLRNLEHDLEMVLKQIQVSIPPKLYFPPGRYFF